MTKGQGYQHVTTFSFKAGSHSVLWMMKRKTFHRFICLIPPHAYNILPLCGYFTCTFKGSPIRRAFYMQLRKLSVVKQLVTTGDLFDRLKILASNFVKHNDFGESNCHNFSGTPFFHEWLYYIIIYYIIYICIIRVINRRKSKISLWIYPTVKYA